MPAAKIGTVQPGGPETRWQWLRLVGNLINLTTIAGLVVAVIGRAKIRRGPRGLFLGEHYKLGFPIASAFTIGSVITTNKTFEELLARNPRLFEHEERHTWQYLACFGLPFYPIYGLFLLWSMLRTGDRAAGNYFERQAGLASGGYQDKPVRPLSEGVRAAVRRVRRPR
jgi:hypothetical protein